MQQDSHPLDLPADAMAEGMRAGRIRAETVVAEALERARAVAGPLNPFVLLREEQALAAARRADAAAARGEATGALHGVPFAAKDLTPTAGDLTTLGSWTEEALPDRTALCIRRLEQAGAILIGKTTTPEFAHSSFTYSPRWGVTRNPWDETRTSGGSSGGSAVAVAAGVVPFAEGTDMGGSVRIPAALCGTVGLKPSLGRIPMTILPSVFDNISHFGPLARTVEDAVAFMAAASGPSDEDIQSLPLAFSAAAARDGRLAGRRFALSVDLGYYEVQPGVETAIRETAALLRAGGAVVEEVSLPWTRAVNDRWLDLWCVFMSAYFGDRLEEHRERMDPAIVELIEQGFALGATPVKRVELLRTAMWRDMARLFERYDALLCPACAVTAPAAGSGDDAFMADAPGGRYRGLDMTCPFNLLPQCPALSLPVGLAADGLPVGLQIVGRRFADEEVLSIALAAERLLAKAGRTAVSPRRHGGRR
ncbi:amidase [Azospirillum picis]|uniref:Asp-tRNA(Asn)/Glu-tRNA(Gln) amidotransferase A subunit family amidase n=1 Tax=Azospirillum picis TaxID=488438 RepID=A0ABU0MMY6_9PROT|nr:amidase [Azospirillum picis]MBP2301200.1 Asp-tRNA(Asn)/Glu-tRNA(Gln) amidotransferase A subunit family amidase [Azospirillum picis]MDQ0534837.1 Asp-tRNA(Asn)/Glu-tRNA(Gln) amidotransferase A subunit family amidase [Azospirillum picis]